MDCNKVSNFPTNGRLENVYIAKLQLCAMQWMVVTNKTCFSPIGLSPVSSTLKYHHTICTKVNQLVSQIPITQSPKSGGTVDQHSNEVVKPTSFNDSL
jgi:hypothetical protein